MTIEKPASTVVSMKTDAAFTASIISPRGDSNAGSKKSAENLQNGAKGGSGRVNGPASPPTFQTNPKLSVLKKNLLEPHFICIQFADSDCLPYFLQRLPDRWPVCVRFFPVTRSLFLPETDRVSLRAFLSPGLPFFPTRIFF